MIPLLKQEAMGAIKSLDADFKCFLFRYDNLIMGSAKIVATRYKSHGKCLCSIWLLQGLKFGPLYLCEGLI